MLVLQHQAGVLKIQSALLEGLVPLGRVKADLHAVIVSLRQSGVNRGGFGGFPDFCRDVTFYTFLQKKFDTDGGSGNVNLP